ncbi:hypothetical protein LTR37_019447 [Vermiconidia calcicola]|uniref:Uncharacterized protein n=1 Tax=Vermiconidia calcicola TaxID=1690605 RepID=A0ACC3MEA0_9PEZI|nr:hypothetical protein LTR37_019447 [Vermiconidia calcicola]
MSGNDPILLAISLWRRRNEAATATAAVASYATAIPTTSTEMNPILQQAYRAGYNRRANSYATRTAFSAAATGVRTAARHSSTVTDADAAEELVKRVFWNAFVWVFYYIIFPSVLSWLLYDAVHWREWAGETLDWLQGAVPDIRFVIAQGGRAILRFLFLLVVEVVAAIIRFLRIPAAINAAREHLASARSLANDQILRLRYNQFTDAAYLHYQETTNWFGNHKARLIVACLAITYVSALIDRNTHLPGTRFMEWTELQHHLDSPIPDALWRHHTEFVHGVHGRQERYEVIGSNSWLDADAGGEEKQQIEPVTADTISAPEIVQSETTESMTAPTVLAGEETLRVVPGHGREYCPTLSSISPYLTLPSEKGDSRFRMFAPPPVQLSRAEVEARLAARGQSAANGGSLTKTTSASSDPKVSPLLQSKSRSPTTPRKSRVFGRKDKSKDDSKVSVKVSAPVATPATPRLEPPKAGAFTFTAEEKVESAALPSGFGEAPRRAPAPPKRSTRPPDEWFSQKASSPAPAPQTPVIGSPPHSAPPPIPEKSPQRQKWVPRGASDTLHLSQEDPFFRQSTLSIALSRLQVEEKATHSAHERSEKSIQSLMAPEARVRQKSLPAAKHVYARDVKAGSIVWAMESDIMPASGSTMNARFSAVKGAKIDKTSARRSSGAASIRTNGLDNLYSFAASTNPPRRATEGELPFSRPSTHPEPLLPGKRQNQGESMSMLLDSGFFPEESSQYKNNHPDVNIRARIPPPLALLNKALPATPTSITSTPTEMYHTRNPGTSRRLLSNRKPTKKKRSPLAQISTTSAKANSSTLVDESKAISPTRLSAIPEIVPTSENSPVHSGRNTPVARQIHLRGGSVITVTPPELTAWKRSVYVQGPIKLPKPVIVPRKNSVASLEPFQEAIEQVYQHALSVPRRRSDDAIVDDVCEFFDDFGFDEISFEGDVLAADEFTVDEMKENIDKMISETERYSTPPAEQNASPVERVFAKEIVEITAKQPPVAKHSIPPLQDEETLRARGIARLSHRAAPGSQTASQARKDSLTLARAEAGALPLLPVPEHSMLEAVLEPSPSEGDVEMEDQLIDHGMDGDDDVEEMQDSLTWLTPGSFPRSPSPHRDPLKTMQHLVATTSTFL